VSVYDDVCVRCRRSTGVQCVRRSSPNYEPRYLSSWWHWYSNQSLPYHRLSFTLTAPVSITHTLTCCCLSCHIYFSPVLCMPVGLPLSLRPILSSSDFTAVWFLQPVILFNSWGWSIVVFDSISIWTRLLYVLIGSLVTSWKQYSIETWLQWLSVE